MAILGSLSHVNFKSRSLMILLVILTAILGVGCGKIAPPPANPGDAITPSELARYTENWTRYTSPNGRVSIEYPACCPPQNRSSGGERDPDVAFLLNDPSGNLEVSFVYVAAEKGLPKGFIAKQIDASQGDAKALTPRQSIEIRGAKGSRQMFAESDSKGGSVFISLGLESNGDSVHMTAGCGDEMKDELWPVCERIVQSIRFEVAKP